MRKLIPSGPRDPFPSPNEASLRMAGCFHRRNPGNSHEVREFDPVLGVWRLVPKVEAVARSPRAVALPYADGSGVFWLIRCRATGLNMWRIEAKSRRDALGEARRLGYANGYGRVNVDVISD